MTIGFQSKRLVTASGEGLNDALYLDAFYTAKDGSQYKLPRGATSDGASVPQEFWNLLPPFGLYWMAAFLHDLAYRNTLFVLRNGEWVRAELTKDQCDNLLLEAMELAGVNFLVRETIYKAVALAGGPSFNEDRAKGWQAFMEEV